MEWFKNHKIATAIIVLVFIAGIGGAAGSGGDTDSLNGASNSNNGVSAPRGDTYRFEDRADKQKDDVEVLPGEVATVGGVQMTLTDVQTKVKLNEFEVAESGNTYLIADVMLENVSDETQPYNVFDFRIQTASGQVLDGAFTTLDTIGSGDIVAGGKATGSIVFEVPAEEGHQYVIWKPNAFNADRAVVQVQ